MTLLTCLGIWSWGHNEKNSTTVFSPLHPFLYIHAILFIWLPRYSLSLGLLPLISLFTMIFQPNVRCSGYLSSWVILLILSFSDILPHMFLHFSLISFSISLTFTFRCVEFNLYTIQCADFAGIHISWCFRTVLLRNFTRSSSYQKIKQEYASLLTE